MSDRPNNDDSPLGPIIFYSITVGALIYGAWLLLRMPIVWFLLVTTPVVLPLEKHIPVVIPDETRIEMRNMVRKVESVDIGPVVRNQPWDAFKDLYPLHARIYAILVPPILLIFAFRWFRDRKVDQIYRRSLGLVEIAQETSDFCPHMLPAIKAEVWKRNQFHGAWRSPYSHVDYLLMIGAFIFQKGTPIEFRIPKQPWQIATITPAEKRLMRAGQFKGVIKAGSAVGLDLRNHPAFLSESSSFSLCEETINKEAIKQLGPLWKGLDSLPPLEKALMTCLTCAGISVAAREKAIDMLNQISRTYVSAEDSKDGKASADLNGISEIRKLVDKSNLIQTYELEHAYKKTMLMRAYDRLPNAAQSFGKLPTTMFLWLKDYDLDLWFTIDKCGSEKPWSETIGAYLHYKNERKFGSRLTSPTVSGAYRSFVEDLHYTGWITSSEVNDPLMEARENELEAIMKAQVPQQERKNAYE